MLCACKKKAAPPQDLVSVGERQPVTLQLTLYAHLPPVPFPWPLSPKTKFPKLVATIRAAPHNPFTPPEPALFTPAHIPSHPIHLS